jgi:hypothetical protein
MLSIGSATALGLVVEVPILIRSLADSFGKVDIGHFPLGFHPSLLAALDDGVALDGPTRLVESYAYDWWKQKKEPVGTVHGFGLHTVHECLDHHRQYIAAPTEAASASEAGAAEVPSTLLPQMDLGCRHHGEGCFGDRQGKGKSTFRVCGLSGRWSDDGRKGVVQHT